MAAVDDIKANLDLDQVAQYLGTDRADADRLVDEALASLVGQLDSNVADPQGAVGLTRALDQHYGSAAFSDRIDLAGIDTADGEKIVDHVYSPTQIQSLGSGMGGTLLQRLLPILAPIVLSYLAKRLGGALSGGGSAGQGGGLGQSSGGGFGDILGDLLGGGSRMPQQPQTQPTQTGPGGGLGGGLGDILGDLLGGSQRSAAPTEPGRTPTAGTGDGTFRSPTPPATDVTADAGAPGTSAGRTQGRTSAGADNPLGGILSDLLFGRR